MRLFIVFYFFLNCFAIFSQQLNQSFLDTLDDELLLSLFEEHYGDSISQEKIARTYLDRARIEKDTIKMARGYDRLARIFHPEKNIAFADSIIYLTKKKKHITYPGLAYILKGIELSKIDFAKSTENYYLAYDHSIENGNISNQLYVLNTLILRKSFWGNSLEALEMQRNMYKISHNKDFKKQFSKTFRKGFENKIDSYILRTRYNAEFNYVICFINLKMLDSADNRLLRAKNKFRKLNNNDNLIDAVMLLELENEIQYYKGNYANSIEISKKIIEKASEINNNSSLYDANLFMGASMFNIGQFNEGLKKLLIADSIYNNEEINLLPYRQIVFDKLLEYYSKENMVSKQIEYYKKVLFTDSIFKMNYSFYENSFYNKIQKPILLAEKDDAINKLKKEVSSPDPKFYVTLAALVFMIGFSIILIRKRLVYKKRFERLISKNELADKEENHKNKSQISLEITNDILEKLHEFEVSKEFLKQNITLINLAKSFKTNSNYLSRVINLKIEKNFSQYIHDLRIEYVLDELLINPTYRKYTIKAIAEECGYNSGESFSKAFYKKTGIYPSFYINQINKKK